MLPLRLHEGNVFVLSLPIIYFWIQGPSTEVTKCKMTCPTNLPPKTSLPYGDCFYVTIFSFDEVVSEINIQTGKEQEEQILHKKPALKQSVSQVRSHNKTQVLYPSCLHRWTRLIKLPRTHIKVAVDISARIFSLQP